jgi:hypothetical protein
VDLPCRTPAKTASIDPAVYPCCITRVLPRFGAGNADIAKGLPMRAMWVLGLLPLLGGCAGQGVPQTPQAQAARLAAAIAAAGISTVTLPVSGQPQINQSFTGAVPVFGRNVPLPPGAWTMAAARSVNARSAGTLASSIALIQRDGARLRAIFLVINSVRPMTNGAPVGTACTSSDVLWNDIRVAVPHGDQDCALVFFERPVLWRQKPNELQYQLVTQFDALGIQPPNILVGLAVHEANRGGTIDAVLLQNPDLDGITPDMATQRAQSAWTAFNYPHDPAKVKFIDALKAQADAIRAGLRKQIDGPAPFVPGTGLTPA